MIYFKTLISQNKLNIKRITNVNHEIKKIYTIINNVNKRKYL